MTLFLTNDDGLGAPGLDALESELGKYHEVWTVAPDREMSAQSHSITLNEGLKLERFPNRRFSVRGTPVDCVNLGLQAVLPVTPELVISGINKGPNLGTDILYSGTCAAAREASLRGIPSISVSYASFKGPWEYERTATFVAENLSRLLELWTPDTFININWPEKAEPGCKVIFARPGKRRYMDEMVSFRSPRGGEYWFLQPAAIESSEEEGTDTLTIHQGDISVSSVAVEPALAQMPAIHDSMEWRGL